MITSPEPSLREFLKGMCHKTKPKNAKGGPGAQELESKETRKASQCIFLK